MNPTPAPLSPVTAPGTADIASQISTYGVIAIGVITAIILILGNAKALPGAWMAVWEEFWKARQRSHGEQRDAVMAEMRKQIADLTELLDERDNRHTEQMHRQATAHVQDIRRMQDEMARIARVQEAQVEQIYGLWDSVSVLRHGRHARLHHAAVAQLARHGQMTG